MWHKEKSDKRDEVDELIIDGNLSEFYSRFHGEVFPSTYIGGDGERSYKVFLNGTTRYSETLISNGVYKPDLLTAYLEEIRVTVKFKKWFLGHYHDN